MVRKTTASTVNLTGAGSTTVGATYSWSQVLVSPTDPDKVTITGAGTLNPSFVLPLYTYPMTNKPLTFRLTVTTVDGSKTDDALVTPTPDTVAIATAKWKGGDFRVTGGGTVVGATIKVHSGSLAGPVLGSTVVTAGPPPLSCVLQPNDAGSLPTPPPCPGLGKAGSARLRSRWLDNKDATAVHAGASRRAAAEPRR